MTMLYSESLLSRSRLKQGLLHFPVSPDSNMREAFVCAVHTCNAGIIHQDYLFEQDGRRRVQDAVDRPEEGGPGLIVEDDDDAGGWQSRTARELPIHTPFTNNFRTNSVKWRANVDFRM